LKDSRKAMGVRKKTNRHTRDFTKRKRGHLGKKKREEVPQPGGGEIGGGSPEGGGNKGKKTQTRKLEKKKLVKGRQVVTR